MGIIKDSLRFLRNIVTLGGAGRLEDAKRLYQETYDEYLALYKKAEAYNAEIEARVTAIGKAIKRAKYSLDRSAKLIGMSAQHTSRLVVSSSSNVLTKVARFNVGYNSAVNLGAGSIAGGSLAVGSWALVTALGSASTGVAISGLSGIAATNATLAWFGGGALIAGGAGMAGGAIVLGGLFAIPLVYFGATGAHKKAKEIENASAELERIAMRVRQRVEEYPAILAAVKGQELETVALCNAFVSDVVKYYQKVRPHGIFSVARQRLRVLFGKDPYTQKQTETLETLSQSVTAFLSSLGIRDDARTSRFSGALREGSMPIRVEPDRLTSRPPV